MDGFELLGVIAVLAVLAIPVLLIIALVAISGLKQRVARLERDLRNQAARVQSLLEMGRWPAEEAPPAVPSERAAEPVAEPEADTAPPAPGP